jgi:hypothetical protein
LLYTVTGTAACPGVTSTCPATFFERDSMFEV